MNADSTYDSHCMVCDGEMEFFFTKVFNSWGLGTLDYDKCADCGFVVSSTLLRMPDTEWTALNHLFHTEIYKRPGDPFDRKGRLAGHAKAINLMMAHGLIGTVKPILDWGSGIGDLALKLRDCNRFMYSFDKYINPHVNKLPDKVPTQRSFSLVIATAVFEHLKNRKELDDIEGLVAHDGVLGFHIAIPKNIPTDPNWVYLLPVHCAFHTWESVRRLMLQWRYEATVYCQEGLMWFFFKSKQGVLQKVNEINSKNGYNYLTYSEGFISSTGIELPLDANHLSKNNPSGLYVGMREISRTNWTSISYNRIGLKGVLNTIKEMALSAQQFDFIYSDLVADRLTQVEFKEYLKHTLCLLKQGGTHRQVTSNLHGVLNARRTGNWKEYLWVKKFGLTTGVEYLNATFRSWGYVFLYDQETLMKCLYSAGYRNIFLGVFNGGRLADLSVLDTEVHRLYVEAVK